jgi:predicted alpha/beta hydrolase
MGRTISSTMMSPWMLWCRRRNGFKRADEREQVEVFEQVSVNEDALADILT